MRGQCTACGAVDYVVANKGKLICEDCFNNKGGVSVDHEMVRCHLTSEAVGEILADGGSRRLEGILADVKDAVAPECALPDNYLDTLGQHWEKEEYKEDGQIEYFRKVDM